MEIHNLLDVKSRIELREWLLQNHKTEKECWVVVKRGRPTEDNTFWYIDAHLFLYKNGITFIIDKVITK